MSREPYQRRSRYLSRDPTTDGTEISKERNSDKREKGAIFYSVQGWVEGDARDPFWDRIPLFHSGVLSTLTQVCPRVPALCVVSLVVVHTWLVPWACSLAWMRAASVIHQAHPYACLYPGRCRHHSFPKPACIHFHNFLFHYNINGTINGKGQEKHF